MLTSVVASDNCEHPVQVGKVCLASFDRAGGGGRAGMKLAFCQVRWLDVASSWGRLGKQSLIMSMRVCVCDMTVTWLAGAAGLHGPRCLRVLVELKSAD